MNHALSRRRFLRTAGGLAAAAGLPVSMLDSARAVTASDSTLTIAYGATPPSWDPTVGISAMDPALQSIYRSVFDTFIDQGPDLGLRPGIVTDWAWSRRQRRVEFEVRPGAFWHDGSPVTPDDVVWSLTRAADPTGGNPMTSVWGRIGNFRVSGQRISADVHEFDPVIFKWMAFLTGFVMPRKAYTKLGPDGFEKQPVGSGPYRVERFERGSFVRLKAFPRYWGPPPQFETVIFKFVADASARVAEVEAGRADLTADIPYEDYDRLTRSEKLAGTATPVSDIGLIFITNRGPMLDDNVRRAMVQSVDKQSIIDRFLQGYGVPIDTLEAPPYAAYDRTIRTRYDPDNARGLLAFSGYTAQNPVRFTIQTTRGFRPRDYEMIQAVAEMWRSVGIEAAIQVYDPAEHLSLRARHELAPAAFFDWSNVIGDPATSTGLAMFSQSPDSAWKSEDLDAKIAPLWTERNEGLRIAGYRAVDKYIADNGLVLPLLQYVQPVLFDRSLAFTPHTAGYVLPQNVSLV
ncbi:MAG: peptide ABC transporter substrate-binding protein [Betaproteobacteria bacterium]|nr:peptide ABC transporter substrate-binding protein [Betaproteobacteria bacterium]